MKQKEILKTLFLACSLHAGSNGEICDKVADISISLKNGEGTTSNDDKNGE